MSFLLQHDIVRYQCTCGSLKQISRIYFCRHCLKIRCGYCVCHEADSHYCGNCLENLPSAEARLKKNRCAACLDCPSCLNTVSTRSTNVTTQNPDDPNKTVTRKAYYLACGFCRWTSRDAGLPDQTVATGGWPERENVHAARISSLLEHYKILALRERQEKERKKFIPRRSYLHFSDKFGLTAVMARKRAGLPPLGGVGLKDDTGSFPELNPSEAVEEVDSLPADIYTKPVNLSQVTTLAQRLAQPEFQTELVSDLFPAHKHLMIKRSQRCRSCEHNVSKPEYNPGSIKFKIQLAAYYHVPEIRIVTCEPLQVDKQAELIIKLCNPTQHQTTVQFLPLPSAEDDWEEREKEIEKKINTEEKDAQKTSQGKDDVSILLPSLSRQMYISEDPRPVNVKLTGEVILPLSSVVLPPRDDAAEYDDSGDTFHFQDDTKVVVWRKANKAAVKMVVIPLDSAMEAGEVLIGFVMKYTYVNTMATLEQKEPQKVDLKIKVFINVGKTVGSCN